MIRSNISTLSFIIYIFLFTGCANTKNEAVAVYEAFFNGLDVEIDMYYIKSKPALPLEDTDHLSKHDKEFIKSFKFDSIESIHTTDSFGNLSVHLIDKKEYQKIFSSSCKSSWEKFFSLYPEAKSLIRISKVGFRRFDIEAMFYIVSSGGCLAGSGSLAHLVKEDGNWVLKNLIQLWVA